HNVLRWGGLQNQYGCPKVLTTPTRRRRTMRRGLPMPSAGTHYDVLTIGSGFGGSVTALRLTEKGYRVGVIEAGRRFADHEFAKNSWHLKDFLWAPKLGFYGIQRVHLLKDA